MKYFEGQNKFFFSLTSGYHANCWTACRTGLAYPEEIQIQHIQVKLTENGRRKRQQIR